MTDSRHSEATLSVSDHVRLLRERAAHIDQLATELRISDGVPPDVLTPIHVHAVMLRERAAKLECGEVD